MKDYFLVTKSNKIVEYDGKSITIYDRSALGVRYISKINHWKGSETELVDSLRAKISFKESKLGSIIHGEEKSWQE